MLIKGQSSIHSKWFLICTLLKLSSSRWIDSPIRRFPVDHPSFGKWIDGLDLLQTVNTQFNTRNIISEMLLGHTGDCAHPTYMNTCLRRAIWDQAQTHPIGRYADQGCQCARTRLDELTISWARCNQARQVPGIKGLCHRLASNRGYIQTCNW